MSISTQTSNFQYVYDYMKGEMHNAKDRNRNIIESEDKKTKAALEQIELYKEQIKKDEEELRKYKNASMSTSAIMALADIRNKFKKN